MFGILTIHSPEEPSLAARCRLRTRPSSGLEQGRGLFRMTIFPWAAVTLSHGWKDTLREKRVCRALCCLQAQGAREVLLPPRWEDLARRQQLIPMDDRTALEACAGAAVHEACRALELPLSGVGLAVYGKAISQAAHMELLALAKSVRTLRIFGEDNDGLRAKLWRGCGIVDWGPMPQGLPVIALRMRGGGESGEALLTVDLTGEDCPGTEKTWQPVLLPPPGAMAQCPPGVPPHRFAAALFTVGALQSREIHVSRLDIAQITPYNKGI